MLKNHPFDNKKMLEKIMKLNCIFEEKNDRKRWKIKSQKNS